jgi:signal recognition particle receptor subunit beta
MALFNYTAKEITLKIVFYGPGFSGKTTNLQFLHTILPTGAKGKLISMATEGDRTIFFDFLPVEIGKIRDFNIRFQLYTVPGQVRYNATRRLVLKGADAIVFVADSQREMNEQNIESRDNMMENLTANNVSLEIPKVFQYNKRDIDNIMSIAELDEALNKDGSPHFEAVAVEGKGVRMTFERITKDVLQYIKEKHNVDIDVPESDLIPEDVTPSKKGEGHIFVKETRDVPVEEETVAAATPGHPAEPVAGQSFTRTNDVGDSGRAPVVERPSVPPKFTEQDTLQEEVASGTLEPPPAFTADLSEIISAINALKNAVSDINKRLRAIQISQAKNSDTLNELKQTLVRKKGKGLRRFFQ